MIVYLDTSSLVKLYVKEVSRAAVRSLVSSAAVVVTSQVAYPETRAALARRRRERSLTSGEFSIGKRDFEKEWPLFVAIPVTTSLCLEAGDLAERHRLRGFDSIHLASFAEMLRGLRGNDDVRFSSFDDRLNRAVRHVARTIR